VALTTIIVAIGRLLANEERVWITAGHDEVRRFVEWGLNRLTASGWGEGERHLGPAGR
jgi:hypothetical protein